METGVIYEFGPYRQDSAARTLTRQGAPVAITPKAFDTLLCLVSNAGRTVSREEMIRALWPDTFVEEGNLSYNISQIRKTLGEYAPGVPYIQTLPKQGYRFVALVSQPNAGQVNGTVKEPATLEIEESSAPPHPAQPKRLGGMWAAVALILLAAAALTTSFLPRHKDTAREATSGLVRLTSDSGLTMTPALSPDGKLVAYASDRSGEGNLDIWVQQVGGAQAIRLTQDPADDYAPSFSPDGRTIAFRSEREGGGIYAVSALGGQARKIAASGRRPKFSPDGKWIAYWIGTEAGDTSSFFMAPGAGKIYIALSAGGPPQELHPEFAAAGYPIWAPDSKYVLFLGNRDPNAYHEGTIDWWVTSIEGGPAWGTGANAAFRSTGFVTVSQAPEAWAPDGAAVLMSAALAETRNIWRVPISSSDWKVSGAPQRLTFGTAMDVQPSAAGNHVVFASLNGNVDVWSLPIDADRAKPAGGLERLTSDAFAHSYPAVSPDGTKLAFSSRRSGNRDIWVRDLRTAKETVVSLPPGPSFNPKFSPDGNALAYREAEKQTSVGYAVSLAAGSPERICEDCSDYDWSHDKKKLLVLGTSPAGISVVDLASKQGMALLNHPAYILWNPRFSPDDHWVSFSATMTSRARIFVAPFRSAGLVPEPEWIAITDGAWDDKPRWSPDGAILYFISQRDGFRCIWAQRLDARKHPAGPAIPIFHAHEARRSLANVGIGDLGISVARDKIVFNMSERTGNLWMTNLDDGR
jgi:eukaryotic-like serine/threonine-protein kinase